MGGRSEGWGRQEGLSVDAFDFTCNSLAADSGPRKRVGAPGPSFMPAQSHEREPHSSATTEVNLVHHVNIYAYDAAMPLTIVAG